jgi:hypothetical protein
VGPSSETKKRRTFKARFFMTFSLAACRPRSRDRALRRCDKNRLGLCPAPRPCFRIDERPACTVQSPAHAFTSWCLSSNRSREPDGSSAGLGHGNAADENLPSGSDRLCARERFDGQHPFGSPATTFTTTVANKVLGFAPRPFDRFAFSRMKRPSRPDFLRLR